MTRKDEREGGAWIGQRPDENTESVREGLDEVAERVAVTDNTALGPGEGNDDAPQGGHREQGDVADEGGSGGGLGRRS